MGFYDVEVDGVKYKCQGHSKSDAIDEILDSDVSGPWGSYKSLRSTLRDDADVRARRTD